MKRFYRISGMWLIIISLGICLGCAQAIDDSEKECTGNSCNVYNDSDDDGVRDGEDNCPDVYNPGQEDSDHDGYGNACDCEPENPNRNTERTKYPDMDNDGRPEQGPTETVCAGDTTPAGLNWTWTSPPPYDLCPNNPNPTCGVTDSDGDGVPDISDCAPNDPTRWSESTIYPDGDSDTIPNSNAPVTQCLGNGTPAYYTRTPAPPIDNCPNVANTNQTDTDHDGIGDACDNNVGDPIVTIVVPVSGANETINVSFTTLATVAYAYPISNLTFTVGSNTICTDATAPYECVITPTALGNLTVTVTAHAANGHTGSTSVTVNVVNAATIRPLYRFVYGWGRDIYHGMTTDCFQGRGWNFTEDDYKTCGANGNLCVMQGEMSDYAIAAEYCEWNFTGPSGGGGNPIPTFPDGCDFSLTGVINTNGTVTYDDELTVQDVYISYDNGITWIQTPDTYIMHSWGANYFNFNETAPQDDEDINVIIGTAVDWDGDGYLNACPADTSCVPDNCIVYTNPDQLPSSIPGVGAACVGHPNPSENDSDNDIYLDGEDAYPFDRTRF